MVDQIDTNDGSPNGVDTSADKSLDSTKECPRCAEKVQSGAKVCRYCNHEFIPVTPRTLFAGLPRTAMLLIAAILLAGGGIGWAVLSAADKSKSSAEPKQDAIFAVQGSLTAPECGGGHDIEFATVEVRDQSGKLIGSSTTSGNNSNGSYGCSVSFDVEVPKATFYQTEIGTHGGPSYSFEEMEGLQWQLDLSLDS